MPLAELPHDSHDASMGLAELKASCRFKLLNQIIYACKSILHNKSNQSSLEGAFSSLLTVETQINFKNTKAHVGRILCFLFSVPLASLEKRKIKYLAHYLLTFPHNTLSIDFSISIKCNTNTVTQNLKIINELVFGGRILFVLWSFLFWRRYFFFSCDCLFVYFLFNSSESYSETC